MPEYLLIAIPDRGSALSLWGSACSRNRLTIIGFDPKIAICEPMGSVHFARARLVLHDQIFHRLEQILEEK